MVYTRTRILYESVCVGIHVFFLLDLLVFWPHPSFLRSHLSLRWMFTVPQVRNWEVNLRIILNLFRIHYFAVCLVVKHLMEMGIYTVKIWYLHGRLYIFQHASPFLRISISFAPIKYLNMRGSIDWSMYEICNFLRRISSRYPICDKGDIRFVTNGNVQIIAFFRRFFTETR